MTQRYFIELSFKGTAYHGWQVQPNAISVQHILEETLPLLIKEKTRLTGAGRTDTGVHAKYFAAHFDTAARLMIPLKEIVRKLNHILPEDIAVLNIFPVGAKDHSRFSAISRTYKYYINRRKNPFRQETSFQVSAGLDLDAMKKAANELCNYRDFSSFCRSNTNVKTHICNIMYAGWKEKNDMLIFTIKADRFLRNMVRAIVGTILNAGYGKMTIEEFRNIIEAGDRRRAGTSAPAHGLFLTGIEYPEEIMINKTNLCNHL